MEELLYEIGKAALEGISDIKNITFPNENIEVTIEMANGDKYKLTLTKEN